MNAWVIHRNQAVFGRDADTFNPTRWLQSQSEKNDMEKYNLTVSA